MKYNFKKIYAILIIACFVVCITASTLAHSGRTDSNGGHKDNKNVSGLGSYHYHCGGNPPHLHENGACPYSAKSSKSSDNEKSIATSVSPSKDTATKSTIIEAIGIQINEKITSMKVGEERKLTATINPTNATNKNIVWKSSDESIAIVSSTGVVVARKTGNANITATTSNGKESTIKISVEEATKYNVNNVIHTSIIENVINDTTDSSSENTDSGSGIIGLGVIGGGCYLGYRKYKKSKKSKE